MKKYILFSLMIIMILALFLTSCNLQTVKIKTDPKIQAPIGATTIIVSTFTGDIKDELTKSLPGAEIISENPFTIRYATDLFNIDFNDFMNTSLDFENIAQPFDKISVSVPSLGNNLQISPVSITKIGSISSVSVSQNINPVVIPDNIAIQNITGLVIPTGSTEVSTTVAFTAGSFDSITFSDGKLYIDINPGKIVSPDAVVSVNGVINGNINSLGAVNVESGNAVLEFPLSGKVLSNNISVDFVINTQNNGTNPVEDIITDYDLFFGFSFDASSTVKAAKGISFSYSANDTKTISLGIDSTAFLTALIDGSINVMSEIPSSWTGISKSLKITLKQNNEIIAQKTINSDNDTIDLSGKEILPQDIIVDTEVLISGENAEFSLNDTEDEFIAGINPVISISSLKGAKVNLNQNIAKPSELVSATFGATSSIIIDSDVDFKGVDGYVSTGTGAHIPLNISAGNIVLDLGGAILDGDIDIIINTVDFDIPPVGEITFNTYNDIDFSELTVNQSGLNISKNISTELPEMAKDMLESVTLKSGSLEIYINNQLPVDIKAKVFSEALGINTTFTFAKTSGATETIDFANKTIDFSNINTFDFSVDASPSGYDGSHVTLSDVKPGKEYFIEGNAELSGVEIGNAVISNVSTSGEFDISSNLSELKNIEFLKNVIIKDVPATLTFNVEGISGLNPDITLYATYIDSLGNFHNNEHIGTQSVEGSKIIIDINNFEDIINGISKMKDNDPLLIGYSLDITGQTVDFSQLTGETEKSPSTKFAVEIPFDIEVTQDATLTDDISFGDNDILGREEELTEDDPMYIALNSLEKLELNFNVDNTSGISAKAQILFYDESTEKYEIFSDSVIYYGNADTPESDIQILKGEHSYRIDFSALVEKIKNTVPFKVKLRILIPQGDYSINTAGSVEIKNAYISFDTDINYSVNIGQ